MIVWWIVHTRKSREREALRMVIETRAIDFIGFSFISLLMYHAENYMWCIFYIFILFYWIFLSLLLSTSFVSNCIFLLISSLARGEATRLDQTVHRIKRIGTEGRGLFFCCCSQTFRCSALQSRKPETFESKQIYFCACTCTHSRIQRQTYAINSQCK